MRLRGEVDVAYTLLVHARTMLTRGTTINHGRVCANSPQSESKEIHIHKLKSTS